MQFSKTSFLIGALLSLIICSVFWLPSVMGAPYITRDDLLRQEEDMRKRIDQLKWQYDDYTKQINDLVQRRNYTEKQLYDLEADLKDLRLKEL